MEHPPIPEPPGRLTVKLQLRQLFGRSGTNLIKRDNARQASRESLIDRKRLVKSCSSRLQPLLNLATNDQNLVRTHSKCDAEVLQQGIDGRGARCSDGRQECKCEDWFHGAGIAFW